MQVTKILKKTIRYYKKLSPELKVPFSLLLYFLFFIVKVSELLQNSIIFLKQKFHKRKHTTKHAKRLFSNIFKKRALRRKEPVKERVYHLPLLTKVKYFVIGSTFSLLFAFLPALMVIFVQDLPNPRELTLRQIPQTTKIYDRNKILLYEFYSNQNRTLVSLNDIPKHLQQATLAIEDKNFYQHPGFDIPSIIRALKENFDEGKRLQGGSTITQQLIKSSLLNSEKSISRKVKELALAFWAERMYSKDEILEMYFNHVPYGGTAWGIEAASEVYFGKHVKQLTLAESAFLAGLTQAPSQYSPYGSNPTLWKNRQKEVLDRMVSLGYINRQTANGASREKLAFKKPQVPLRAPHFVMYIKELLAEQHGLAAVEKGGLSVITSLDLKKQDEFQKVVAEEVEKAAYLHLTNGAVLVTNPTNGDIIAMVGSKDFDDAESGNVNLATSHRPPGSTVKVITYSAALMNGMTAASVYDDAPASFASGAQTYRPVNYGGRYFGRVTLRFALANSLNIPAVQTLQRVGVDEMVGLARRMGVTTWTDPEKYGLSVTLGGADATMLDMATVFGTLSNKGRRVDINPILSITDSKGNVLEKKNTAYATRVLPEGVAYIISDILSDNQARTAAFGPNSPLVIPGHAVSVKTGTSDNIRDNWAIGYTKDHVVTVWVGNNDNSPMSQNLASGITGAAPIWHRVMASIVGKTPTARPLPPSDITTRQCAGRVEYFLKGTEGTAPCVTLPTPKLYSAQ